MHQTVALSLSADNYYTSLHTRDRVRQWAIDRVPPIDNTFRTNAPSNMSLRFMLGSGSPFMNTFLDFSFQRHKEIRADLSQQSIINWGERNRWKRNWHKPWTFKCQVRTESSALECTPSLSLGMHAPKFRRVQVRFLKNYRHRYIWFVSLILRMPKTADSLCYSRIYYANFDFIGSRNVSSAPDCGGTCPSEGNKKVETRDDAILTLCNLVLVTFNLDARRGTRAGEAQRKGMHE